MKGIKNFEEILNKRMWLVLSFILLINFGIRLLIYYNTTLFYFSDFKSYLNAIDSIKENGSISLVQRNFLYLNSYIGYFFKYILGSIDYYFIFNCLLGTLTSLITFFIIKEIVANRTAALLVVFFQTMYVEFVVFSSIFYTPIIMIFILNLVIFLIIKYSKTNNSKKILFYVSIIVVLILLSLYLKPVLKYFWILLILVGFVSYYKNRDKFFSIKFIFLGIFLCIFQNLIILSGLYPTPLKSNAFIFFGHTLYGGDGGEGGFVYSENKKKYDVEFQKYLKNNNISKPTLTDENNFQIQEVKRFIFNHPFKWIKLQLYKFFRTFGIVPEGYTFKIMISGITKGKLILTSLVLVLPISIFIILFLLILDVCDFKKILSKNILIFLCLLGIYYLIATIFYGSSQERYRMPFVVTFLIPYIAYKLTNFKLKKLSKKKIIMTLILVISILAIWGLQAYDALIVHKDRYFGAAEKAINMKLE